jgi:molecular chaperone GrpE
MTDDMQGPDAGASTPDTTTVPTDGASDPVGQNASGDTATLSSLPEWQRQLEEQREKYLRLAAEYDNFRKRSARERQEAGWRAQGDLVQGLIDILDDLMRFGQVDPATTDVRTVVDGVGLVEKKLFKSLSGHGLEVVNPVDHPFDPAVHEAITTTPAGAAEEENMVAQVYQPGYLFRGQLLRPARVVVKQWHG